MTRKNRIVLFIMFGIGIAIFLLSLREISFRSFVHDVTTLNLWWLGIAFLCMFLSLVFEALVIKILVQRQIKSYPFFDALRVPKIINISPALAPITEKA